MMVRIKSIWLLWLGLLPLFAPAQTPKKLPIVRDSLLNEADLSRKPTFTNIGQAYRQAGKVYRLQLKTSGSLYGKVTDVHYRIDSLINLQYFQCSNEALEILPASFGTLLSMQQLYLSGNKLAALPDTLYQLRNLKRLDLAGNQLVALSPKIAYFTQLELLYLHNNKMLKDIPIEQIGKLQNLRFLNIRGTKISREQGIRLQKLLPKCKVEID